jgi:hypothetical protein
MFFFKNNKLRRTLGAALMVTGVLLIWLSPTVQLGALMLAAGIALEGIGIWLEHGRSQS